MIIRDNNVLLGSRKSSHGAATYAWLGGHLEFGETFEECAIRKVYEESGLIVRSLEFLCVSNIIEYGTHYLDIEFMATDFEGEPRSLKHTIDEWKWYPLDELPLPLFRPVELAINSYFKSIRYNR